MKEIGETYFGELNVGVSRFTIGDPVVRVKAVDANQPLYVAGTAAATINGVRGPKVTCYTGDPARAIITNDRNAKLIAEFNTDIRWEPDPVD